MQKQSMKNFKTILLLSSFCLFSTACRTTRQVVKTTDTVQKEISESKVSYRDTILYTQKAQTSLKLPLSDFKKCTEEFFKQPLKGFTEPFKQAQVYTQKNGNAKATVRIEHDTVTVTAECDSIALRAQIRTELNNKFNSEKASYINELKEKVKTDWWSIIALCVIFFIAGFIVKSLIKISI